MSYVRDWYKTYVRTQSSSKSSPVQCGPKRSATVGRVADDPQMTSAGGSSIAATGGAEFS